jgi:hypothetical protein
LYALICLAKGQGILPNRGAIQAVAYTNQGIILLIGSVLFCAFRPWRGSSNALWIGSWIVTVALWASTVSTIRTGVMLFGNQVERGVTVVDQRGVEKILADHGVSPQKSLFVKTGLYVASFEFTSSNNVAMHGYVWQIYPKDSNPKIVKGLVFPEAVDAGFQSSESYRVKRSDGSELIGWHFNGSSLTMSAIPLMLKIFGFGCGTGTLTRERY